ncbi:MAG: FHA domain-containing protein [Armatimonadetes bacterium]|nr:FHA domain-containing protein [Armatimonadota bacterium]
MKQTHQYPRVLRPEASTGSARSTSAGGDPPAAEENAPTAAAPGTIVGLEGTWAGRSAALIPGQISIGSDPSNQLPISDDDAVSDFHAGMIRQSGTWYCFDLQSETGTLVNGERITGRLNPLPAGAVIRVGGQAFRVDYDPPGKLEPVRTTWVPPPPSPALEFD